jgi:hypothetical protein
MLTNGHQVRSQARNSHPIASLTGPCGCVRRAGGATVEPADVGRKRAPELLSPRRSSSPGQSHDCPGLTGWGYISE